MKDFSFFGLETLEVNCFPINQLLLYLIFPRQWMFSCWPHGFADWSVFVLHIISDTRCAYVRKKTIAALLIKCVRTFLWTAFLSIWVELGRRPMTRAEHWISFEYQTQISFASQAHLETWPQTICIAVAFSTINSRPWPTRLSAVRI